jgi:predicted dehydrogenase
MSTRWGVIGTGTISDRFVPDLQVTSGGNVRGVWGRAQERADAFAAEHGIPFATAERSVLLARDDIDAVYIATPMQTHLGIALEALDAGKHVLIEKPMAMTPGEVDTIFGRARQVGRFAMEAMWMRFNPLHLDVMTRINEGLLGEIHSVRASFGMPSMSQPGKPNPAPSGSAWLDRGIYAVTLAQWALGTPNVIRASGTASKGVDISGHATLEFDNGSFAHLACSSVTFLELSASVSGARGWATFDPMFWAGTTAELRAGALRNIFHEPQRVEHPREGNGFRPMLQAVHQTLSDGFLQHPHHNQESTRAVATTLEIIRQQILEPTGDHR